MLLVIPYLGISQGDVIFINDFNDGSVQDPITGISGIFSGRINTALTCGVDGDGLELDGNQFIEYPPELNAVLDTSEFSLSFYIRPTSRQENTPQVVFSHRTSIERDSSMVMHYLPENAELLVEFSEDESSIERMVAELDPEDCWYFITIVKTDNVAEIYVGDQKRDEIFFSRPFSLSERATLKVADSPLIGSDYQRYQGVIDEITIRTGILESLLLQDLDYNADRIISRDTTIFEGESIEIEIGTSCADRVSWTPDESLDDPMAFMPTASPSITTTYLATFDYGNCSSVDSVRVGVVGDDISCADLILPKAFTPNGDGLNDTYGISSIFLIDELLSFEIFDKWGSKVFSTSRKEDMWDGLFNGRVLDPGMFLYRIQYICEGQENLRTGSFSLIN